MRAGRKIIDAEFEVVRGPPKIGERHPTRRGWYFTGDYDPYGTPLFKAWWLVAFERVFAAVTLGVVVLTAIPLVGFVLLLIVAVVIGIGLEVREALAG